MSDARSFATLNLVGGDAGGEGYGTGVVVEVPRAMPEMMVMDGLAEEAAWQDAPMFNLLANADFFAVVEEPDLAAEAKALWSQDTLYVYAHVFDNEFFVPEAGDAWQSDQLLIGIDPTHMADSLYDADFSGAPQNAPDAGPYAYKVWLEGITLNWGFDGIFPADSGWVNGAVFRNDETLEWGFEAAFYVPQVAAGEEIGFNVGGAQASQTALDMGESEATYGFYSWQVCDISGEFCSFPGGSVMSDARSFATLELVEEVTVGVEEDRLIDVPASFVLEQNYPNPFNPATTITYGLHEAGEVAIEIYDALGQRVDRLIAGQRPAGTYRLRWQADALPSGVYFYHLVVNGTVEASRRMLLVK